VRDTVAALDVPALGAVGLQPSQHPEVVAKAGRSNSVKGNRRKSVRPAVDHVAPVSRRALVLDERLAIAQRAAPLQVRVHRDRRALVRVGASLHLLQEQNLVPLREPAFTPNLSADVGLPPGQRVLARVDAYAEAAPT
jgi:hypothetical protein